MVACRRRRYRVASDIHQPEHKADSSPEASRVSLRRGNSCTLSGRNGRRPPLRKNWRIRHAACHRDRNPVNSPSNHRRTFIPSPFVFDVPYHYRSCGILPSARHDMARHSKELFQRLPPIDQCWYAAKTSDSNAPAPARTQERRPQSTIESAGGTAPAEEARIPRRSGPGLGRFSRFLQTLSVRVKLSDGWAANTGRNAQ